MAWEEKCIGCLCNSCFYKNICCGGGSSCRKRKNCKDYDSYIPESATDDETEGE